MAVLLRTQDRDMLEDSYNDLALTIDRKPYPTKEAIRNTFQMVAQADPKALEANPMSMWDLSLLKELDQRGFIDSLYR